MPTFTQHPIPGLFLRYPRERLALQSPDWQWPSVSLPLVAASHEPTRGHRTDLGPQHLANLLLVLGVEAIHRQDSSRAHDVTGAFAAGKLAVAVFNPGVCTGKRPEETTLRLVSMDDTPDDVTGAESLCQLVVMPDNLRLSKLSASTAVGIDFARTSDGFKLRRIVESETMPTTTGITRQATAVFDGPMGADYDSFADRSWRFAARALARSYTATCRDLLRDRQASFAIAVDYDLGRLPVALGVAG